MSKTLTYGSGKKILPLKHSISNSSLLTINNDDNYCLFYSLEMGRINTLSSTISQHLWLNIRKNPSLQRGYVIELMTQCGIPFHLDEYDIETYGNIVQEYYNKLYPGQFKIFCFSDYGFYKPIFKSNVSNFNNVLCVYYINKHFHCIKNIRSFFKN